MKEIIGENLFIIIIIMAIAIVLVTAIIGIMAISIEKTRASYIMKAIETNTSMKIEGNL